MAQEQSQAANNKAAMEATASILDSVIEETSAREPVTAGFGTKEGFELMLRQAKWLASSDLVPKQFQGNIANAVIALEMANRMGASPLSVMQNIYIVHGKPGWSAQFIIAAVNTTGKFTPIRYSIKGEGQGKECVAWATEKATGERLESPPVSIGMAKVEGWIDKQGSKWKTMPDLMLRYRAATLFGRLYAPEVLMGMKTVEEIEDIGPEEPARLSPQAEIEQNANTEEIDIQLDEPQETDSGLTDEEKAKIIAQEKAEAEAGQGINNGGPGF
jgi:hypothetical protein